MVSGYFHLPGIYNFTSYKKRVFSRYYVGIIRDTLASIYHCPEHHLNSAL